MIDYRDLMKRYIETVGSCEGVYFLKYLTCNEEEQAFIDGIVKELDEENQKALKARRAHK